MATSGDISEKDATTCDKASPGPSDTDVCVLCNQCLSDGQSTVTLRQKGVAGLQRASRARGESRVDFYVGQILHTKCRHDYCNEHTIKRDLSRQGELRSASKAPSLRSSQPKFDFANDCLLCGTSVRDQRKKCDVSAYQVRTSSCQANLELMCLQRGPGDKWAEAVRGRIEYVQDLHAADAVYHQQCNVNFRTGRNMPQAFRSDVTQGENKKGRPEDEDRLAVFFKVVSYLKENDDQQMTIGDLCQKMQDYLGGEEPYSKDYMKKKLMKTLDSDIIITNMQGKENVVTFRMTAERIMDQFWKTEKGTDTSVEKLRIIDTAAKLILSDIKDLVHSKNVYPTREEISDLDANLNYLPASLVLFLQSLMHGKKESRLKTASIGQALLQATRPNILLPPLQVGLGVQVHHLYGSRSLIELLNKLGFCTSYHEVQRFEQCAASSQGTDLAGVSANTFIQFVADNVDHNLRTLDGSGTFHGMGIIGAVTPGEKHTRRILRDTSVNARQTSTLGHIPLHFFSASKTDVTFKYEELQDFSFEDMTRKLDLLWKVSWPLRTPRPGWSGLMQMVSEGSYPGQSTVTFLPMIDMQPTNMTCVYSTLHFVANFAAKYNVNPVLTFDQPLWWKAQLIVDNEPAGSHLRSLILRLGGFHTQMSYLGSIGRLMTGSGLQELLEVIYAPDAVVHMLSGKAIARAVRGHFLVDAVLNALLASSTFGFSISTTTTGKMNEANETQDDEMEVTDFDYNSTEACDDSDDPCLSSCLQLFDQLLKKEVSADVVASSQELEYIEAKLAETRSKLLTSRTSCLWIQYMQMLDILKKFIKGERTGNWNLHLHSLKEMLPYLSASGHSLYAKSVYIYLQQMQTLQDQHPETFRAFTVGYHVLRRSDRFWAGLSPDLVIEQTLMRSVKSAGGLTRGRGMGDSQRTQWLLSRPACADMNSAMNEVTGSEGATNNQHAESSLSRQKRDDKDMRTLLSFLLPRNPFACDETLRSISTGVVADQTVNADRAKEVGQAILESMRNAAVKDYTFKRKEQVVTMGLKSATKIDGEVLQVDPQLLFQRLVTVANGLSEELDLPSVFEYELSYPPASLFESSGLLRESNKANLANALVSAAFQEAEQVNVDDTSDIEYVLDGGSLLHRIPWRRSDTFAAICQTYASYVTHMYRKPWVIFDGYSSGPSTKDATHLRRSSGAIGPTIRFTPEMVCSARKEHFLANVQNKEAFVHYLGEILEGIGCQVLHAEGDADALIVSTAVSCAVNKTTVVIGEDTDLLVLLLHHADLHRRPMLLKSASKAKKHKEISILSMKIRLGPQICHFLPFLHAINGCDTTSRLFGVGKGLPLKKIKTDANFKIAADTFCTRGKSTADIAAAGEKALISLYGGRAGDTLDTLRYHRFWEKVTSSVTTVQVRSLPPSSAAAKYHSLRVYLQVQHWIDRSCTLQPEMWGWQLSHGRLDPCTTDLPPAPELLLQVIRCNCKTDCQSKRCTCRKHGLECSLACGECKGISCANSPTLQPLADSDIPDLQDEGLLEAPDTSM